VEHSHRAYEVYGNIGIEVLHKIVKAWTQFEGSAPCSTAVLVEVPSNSDGKIEEEHSLRNPLYCQTVLEPLYCCVATFPKKPAFEPKLPETVRLSMCITKVTCPSGCKRLDFSARQAVVG